MRQMFDPWVMAGPLLQPIRGLLFGARLPVRQKIRLARSRAQARLLSVLLCNWVNHPEKK
jgi:hypothetical protein